MIPIKRALTVATGLALVTLLSAPGFAKNPYELSDAAWIRLSGTVKDVHPDTFRLDYGDGMITVEMDDGDRDADAYQLLTGDKVTVSGRIDQDFLEQRTIEASSVYVEKLQTHFLASAVDEEDWPITNVVTPLHSGVTLYGTVTDVDETEFTLLTIGRMLRVDVGEMAYNPLDEEGYQHVEVGDRVQVSGEMSRGFFEGRQLKARSIQTLRDASEPIAG